MPWFQKNNEGKSVMLSEDTQVRLQLFANRGKLQKALHSLMMKRVEMPNADLVEFATKVFNGVGVTLIIFIQKHINVGENKNEFTPEEFENFLNHYAENCSEESMTLMGEMTEEDIEQIFEAIDTDHSGTISLAEFLECNNHLS